MKAKVLVQTAFVFLVFYLVFSFLIVIKCLWDFLNAHRPTFAADAPKACMALMAGYCTLSIYSWQDAICAWNLYGVYSVRQAIDRKTGSECGRPWLELLTTRSTESGIWMSSVHFENKTVMHYVAPSSTALRPKWMKLSSKFRLSETKHQKCGYDKFIKNFQYFLFSFFLSASIVLCCTKLLTVMVLYFPR